jgi:proteic killer suppression protein
MIRSFQDDDTRLVFERKQPRRLPADIVRRAHRKLLLLHHAHALDDLRAPPGNRLEKLVGDRTGQHSIRINDQWRVCFRWDCADALEVQITDYHD